MKSTWLSASAEDVFLPSALNAHFLFEIGSELYCIKVILSHIAGFESKFLVESTGKHIQIFKMKQ